MRLTDYIRLNRGLRWSDHRMPMPSIADWAKSIAAALVLLIVCGLLDSNTIF